jgi:hypothetical protein
MSDRDKPVNKMILELQERFKELTCLYQIEELLTTPGATIKDIFNCIIKAIPPGWQYPDLCQVRIIYEKIHYCSSDFKETPWFQKADIIFQGKSVGSIEVYYVKAIQVEDEGPFLKEERKLLNTISERLSHFIMQRHLEESLHEMERIKKDILENRRAEWKVIVDLLSSTDQNLLMRITRKMMNYLCRSGISQACMLLQNISINHDEELDENRPAQKKIISNVKYLTDETFAIAEKSLSDDEIIFCIQKWIKEDKSSFLVNTLENPDSLITEIADAIRRYKQLSIEDMEFPPFVEKGLRVSLIRRFFTDQLQFINVAKNYIEINDFYELFQRIILPLKGHGKLGGKSSGLFLAMQILKKTSEHAELFKNLKSPKTWYITSDGLLSFFRYNNLEDVVEQKYKEIDQVRQEYPHIIQVFKNSHMSPEIVKGLSMALDDFGDRPLIVRSSSLLEDRMGTAFSGKYKSLFIANQGTKQERLEALIDAIEEVYASTLGPDPIEYRAERGLLDFHEEMGIMIQEVVGTRVGKYFLPAFAGVAFSNNEFRWSPRIKREDGLVRLVPGLGTRAVDRVSDDYPKLIAPGQPGLKVNVSVEETVRYAPKKIDVINLETNKFETIEIKDLLKKYGNEYQGVNRIFSIYEDDNLKTPMGFEIDFEKDDLIVTFDGLLNNTSFVKQMNIVLTLLKEKMETPVDIEFASDGKDFYLLQCRPQSYAEGAVAAPIPKDIPEDRIIFSANRYVSNGKVPDITHIVYVDPENYNRISSLSDLTDVGIAVGKLNKLLPKRQFILMGPGRWGSRGDIKLGVNVTYSDINNTAVLIEIARKKGNYLPDLSFGTHFFQDLVESSIRYLPLYPDDEGIIFNERFLKRSHNILPDILPDYSFLSDILHVIDVPQSADGMIMNILMNADLDEAVGLLSQPKSTGDIREEKEEYLEQPSEEYWRWRLYMAERIAAKLNPSIFPVKALYIFGSTKNAMAGPGSDIDLLVHFDGSEKQKRELLAWLHGWSFCLSELNFLRTGYKTDGLLDIHIVTDEDILKKTSYAVKIGAVTDAARPLVIGNGMKSAL